MANEQVVKRTAVASFALSNGATTLYSGVLIPAGAIVTGLRIHSPDAVTLTNASATVVPKVGTVAIAATTNISDLAAQTVPTIVALATTDGIYVPADGDLNLVIGTTNTSTAAGTYDYYVDYLYIVS